ncbi:hypothetical protein QVD99_004814 [Batrachochytrium dendrobatidis]|nr:hypothetical protein O5D80_003053 [Batrachochytrium dendrobatidis]KAK5669050.1 hypothetical protein QVD99_004814 [Batrachochytrium dendrobatidis]
MISAGARHFAKFSMRATPKHTMKAMCGSPSRMMSLKSTIGPCAMSAFPTRFAIPSIISVIPSIAHVGGTSPSSTADISVVPQVIKSQNRTMSTTSGTDASPREMITCGSTIDAGEDLDVILRKAPYTPVRIDLYSNWYKPCRILGPVIEEFVSVNQKCSIVNVNIDNDWVSSRHIVLLSTVATFMDAVLADCFDGNTYATCMQ